MAFQIDPSIPLQAQRTTFDPASILMQAQQNSAALEKHRFEMQKLREDYDAQKEARKQQKAMQMGIASDLAGIQSGSPAQYAPMQFQQTPQQPKAYTGDLMGGDFQLGGNNDPTNGSYQLGGGEVTQEAIAGRQPTYAEMLAIGLKQAMLTRNQDEIFKYAKAIQETEKQATKWGMNPTKGINPQTMQPDYFVVNELGQKQFLGVNPYETPKDAKAPVTWTVPNGRKETTYGYDANGKQIVLGVKNLDAPKADKTADHPVYFNTTLTGDAFLKTLSPVDQAHVKALNEGREPFPTAKMMASNPYYERLADAVAQYNPDFDATAYNTRKTASAAFTTGIQGRQLLAFGSAVKHLETLGGLVDAMANGDTVQLNRFSNLLQKQTGGVPVNNFEAAKGIVAKEIMKSIVTGGGGVEERQELSHLMDSAKSPEQLRGVINTYLELMNAQKENLLIQRDAAGLSRSTLPDYSKHSADDKSDQSSRQDDYKEYVLERGKAYKSGNYDLVRQMDSMAKQDGLIK